MLHMLFNQLHVNIMCVWRPPPAGYIHVVFSLLFWVPLCLHSRIESHCAYTDCLHRISTILSTLDVPHVIKLTISSTTFLYCKQRKVGQVAWEWGYFSINCSLWVQCGLRNTKWLSSQWLLHRLMLCLTLFSRLPFLLYYMYLQDH